MTDDFLKLCNEIFYVKDDILYNKINRSTNSRKDQEAGNIDNNYRRVKIKRKSYLTHRIIFLMHHGYLPDVVDHINGNTFDNSIDNLRDSNKMTNRWNCVGNSNTLTGVKGVYVDGKKFKALVNVNGKRYYLGMYDTIAEAKIVVDAKYIELQKEFSLQNSRKFSSDTAE